MFDEVAAAVTDKQRAAAAQAAYLEASKDVSKAPFYWRRPLVIAWANNAHNHFVPLMPVQTMAWPVFRTRPPQAAIDYCMAAGVTDPFCNQHDIGKTRHREGETQCTS